MPTLPPRRSRRARRPQMPLNRALRHIEPQLQQLATNAFCSPEAVLARHTLNQLDDFGGESRFALTRFRLPLPEEPKTFPMPTQNGVWFHEEHSVSKARNEFRECSQQAALMRPKRGAFEL